MHVHGHLPNFNAVDLSSARAAERAASAQRAADVRGRLSRGGPDIERETTPFESFMVGGDWEGSSQQRSRNQRENDANTTGQPMAAEEQQADEPLSFWA